MFRTRQLWNGTVVQESNKAWHTDDYWSAYSTSDGDMVIHADDAAAYHGFRITREMMERFLSQVHSVEDEQT